MERSEFGYEQVINPDTGDHKYAQVNAPTGDDAQGMSMDLALVDIGDQAGADSGDAHDDGPDQIIVSKLPPPSRTAQKTDPPDFGKHDTEQNGAHENQPLGGLHRR
ncbi:hypothetical protein D3C87_894090 [compost metagenome]